MDKAIQRALEAELEASRRKYPSPNCMGFDADLRICGIMQEFGEALQALSKYQMHPCPATLEHSRLELTQAAAQAIRFLEEIQ